MQLNKAFLILLVCCVPVLNAYAEEKELHPGHNWLKNKTDSYNVSCCDMGDCKVINQDQFWENPDGSFTVRMYERNIVFERSRVFPTEDVEGKQYACITINNSWDGKTYSVNYIKRCLFIMFGS